MFADERGASELLGFVLAFSIVVTSLAIYQSDVVPHQNREAEIEYSADAAADMSRLQATVGDVGSTGASATTTLSGGATYPDRALAINAPPPHGLLETTDRYTVAVSGFRTTDARYWDGSTRTFQTRLLRFHPRYNYYQGNESFYLANGVAVKHVPEADFATRISGELVDGDRIDLTLVSGEFQRTGRSFSPSVGGVSTGTEYRTVEVTEPSDPADGFAYVRVPTVRSQSDWSAVADSSANVDRVDVSCPGGSICTAEIVFEPGTYQLRIVNVSVGESTSPPATYLTMRPAGEITANDGQTFVVTARDQFGNPVSGADVDVSKSGPGSLTASDLTTDSRGRVTFSIKSAELGVTTVIATLDDAAPDPSYETVSLTVGSGGGGGSPSLTVYTSGQLRTGLGAVESLVLSDGMMVPGSQEDCLLIGDTGGLIGGLFGSLNCDDESYDTLQGQLRIETTNSKRYTLMYVLVDEDENGEIDASDTKKVYVESRIHGMVFEGELNTGDAKDALDQDGVDLLEADSYDSTDWGSCGLACTFSDLDLSQADVLFVDRAAGRVTVNASSN